MKVLATLQAVDPGLEEYVITCPWVRDRDVMTVAVAMVIIAGVMLTRFMAEGIRFSTAISHE
jgi:hypothetical protein